MPHKRGPWSTSEDANLLNLVHHHGPQNWVRISQHLGSRSPKQCRERYHQNLKPTLNHSPITPREGELIENLVKQIGRRWADISRRLPGRSDNAVKNWWNGGVNRRRRVVVRRDGLSKPVGTVAFGTPPFLQGQVATVADQRALPSSMSQMPPHVPLMSPVRSEVSMPESMEEASSMVSDNGSQQTIPSPSEYGHILHSAPNAGAGTPGLWHRGSNLPSGMLSQNLSSRPNPTSPVVFQLAGRFDSTSTACRLHHLSDIAANKDLLPIANHAHASVVENALAPRPTGSVDITTQKAEQPFKRLHDVLDSTDQAGSSDQALHQLAYSMPSHNHQYCREDAQQAETVRSTVEMTSNLTGGAYYGLNFSSSLANVHQASLEHDGQKQGSPTTATAHIVYDKVSSNSADDHSEITNRKSGEIPDPRKNKMTLSSILL